MIMTKMPKQFYILGLVLLLYWWPWQLFGGDLPADWLISVITMQLFFVIFCNKFVRDNWILPVIIIEAACMLVNIAYVLMPDYLGGIHSSIIIVAFIMEILSITTSTGVINGRANSYHLSLASGGLWRVRGGVFRLYRDKESLR